MHEVQVNRLGGLSLPRKSVVRLTDRPDMTLDVYHGRKTTIQQQQSTCSFYNQVSVSIGREGWLSVAMVLGITSSAERPTGFDNSRARVYCAFSSWALGLFGIFFFGLSYLFSPSLAWGDSRI